MKLFFDLLGVMLALYVVYCVLNGRVIVKSGPGARTYQREVQPNRYWLSIAIYSLLAVALITVF